MACGWRPPPRQPALRLRAPRNANEVSHGAAAARVARRIWRKLVLRDYAIRRMVGCAARPATCPQTTFLREAGRNIAGRIRGRRETASTRVARRISAMPRPLYCNEPPRRPIEER